MVVVLVLVAAVALLGWYMGVSRALIVGVSVVLLLLPVGFHAFLPAGNVLRLMVGGSLLGWSWLLGVALVVLAYAMGLRWLKSRAPEARTTASRPVQPPATHPAAGRPDPFSDDELERYARHIILREIGGPGQMKLGQSRVLVVGAGGLGSPALMYLAAAGVGHIGIIDDDRVSLSNLQRQILHATERIDMPKVESARQALAAINPHVEVIPFDRRLGPDNAPEVLKGFDLVLDGSDNFATRYLVNELCTDHGVPLIAAAISQWEGQISLYDPANGTPCYACIFPRAPAEGLAPSCAEAGVIGALPGVVGAMMAVEAIKHITGAGQTLRGEMLIYDALYGESRKMNLARNPDCPVCGNGDATADKPGS